jgi:hypothetical protein
MKVIFLDIDGVLNSWATRERTPSGFVGIGSLFVEILAEVCRKTGACLVLSSDWKEEWEQKGRDGRYLEEKLASSGLTIAGRTYEDDYRQRGRGILAYLEKHEVEHFVVLDDRKFDFQECGLDDFFVHTDPRYGLTRKDAEKAVKILGTEA